MADVQDSTQRDRMRCYTATFHDDWIGHPGAGDARDAVPCTAVAVLRRGLPIVSAAGFDVGDLDGVVVDADGLVTHLVAQPGHRFGDRDLVLPIARACLGTDPIRVVLSRAAIAALPPAMIHWSATPTLLPAQDIGERRRRVVRCSPAGTHRRTAIPRRRPAERERPALVAV